VFSDNVILNIENLKYAIEKCKKSVHKSSWIQNQQTKVSIISLQK
jgi:hypothetical protein